MADYVWHYTAEETLAAILRDGEIAPALLGIGGHEKPVAWLSANPHYEPTAIKQVGMRDGSYRQMTLAEQVEHFGAARIAIDRADTLPFARLVKAAKISPTTQRRLLRATLAKGASPADWYGVIGSAPRALWRAVEVMRDGKWTPLPAEAWQEPAQ